MNKRFSVRIYLAEFIYDIITEIEVVGAIDLELIENAVLIKALFNKSLIVIFNLFH